MLTGFLFSCMQWARGALVRTPSFEDNWVITRLIESDYLDYCHSVLVHEFARLSIALRRAVIMGACWTLILLLLGTLGAQGARQRRGKLLCSCINYILILVAYESHWIHVNDTTTCNDWQFWHHTLSEKKHFSPDFILLHWSSF
jgi:hypothetical protein